MEIVGSAPTDPVTADVIDDKVSPLNGRDLAHMLSLVKTKGSKLPYISQLSPAEQLKAGRQHSGLHRLRPGAPRAVILWKAVAHENVLADIVDGRDPFLGG